MSTNSGIYIVPTDRWYIERTVWLIAGCVLVVATILALLVHPLAVLFVVVASVASMSPSRPRAATGWCP